MQKVTSLISVVLIAQLEDLKPRSPTAKWNRDLIFQHQKE